MPHISCGSAGVFVGIFSFLCFITGPTSPLNQPTKVETLKLAKSQQEEHFDDIPMTCTVRPLQIPKHKIESTFLSSYPGSGTRMQWELVEALTGVPTTDDAFTNGHHNVIGIKTHYPCPAGREFPGAENVLRAIVFLRHPMDTLPAYYDIIHASEQNIPYEIPPRAPVTDWVNWRDMAFVRELEIWRKHFVYWMDRYHTLNRLIVPFEQLISRKHGPEMVANMAEFLSRSDGVSMAHPDDIPCLWQTVLQRSNFTTTTTTTTTSSNTNPSKVRRRLQQQLPASQSAQTLSASKLGTMSSGHEPIRADATAFSTTDFQLPKQGPPSAIVRHTTTDGSTKEKLRSETLSRPTDSELEQFNSRSSSPPGFSQTMHRRLQQQSLHPKANRAKLFGEVPVQATEELQGTTKKDDAAAIGDGERTIEDRLEEKGAEKPDLSSSSSSSPQASQPEQKSSSSSSVPQKQKQEKNSKNSELTTEELLERDPNFRPYTKSQRKEVVIVLAQLLELYRDDKVLTPILVDYIDEVEKRYMG